MTDTRSTAWDQMGDKARVAKYTLGSGPFPRCRFEESKELRSMRNKVDNLIGGINSLSRDISKAKQDNIYTDLNLDALGAGIAELFTKIADKCNAMSTSQEETTIVAKDEPVAEVTEKQESSYKPSTGDPSLVPIESATPQHVQSPTSSAETTFSAKALDCKQMAAQNRDCPDASVDDEDGERCSLLALHHAKVQVGNSVGALRKVDQEILYCMRKTLYADLGLEEVASVFGDVLTRIQRQDDAQDLPKPKEIVSMPKSEIVVVDNTEAVIAMLQHIFNVLEKDGTTMLAVDLEGIVLSRDGDIAILALFISGTGKVYLVDVFTLRDGAFTTSLPSSTYTLKHVLESPTIAKLLWDCRADNDALVNLFQVKMAGVVDVQLMDLATRHDKLNTVKSLALAVSTRAQLTAKDKQVWRDAKTWGEQAMQMGPGITERRIKAQNGTLPESQSIYTWDNIVESWNLTKGKKLPDSAYKFAAQRPMHDLIKKYCAADVVMLPQLCRHYIKHKRWSFEWANRVKLETRSRLDISSSPCYDYDAHGNEAPEDWRPAYKRDTQLGLPLSGHLRIL